MKTNLRKILVLTFCLLFAFVLFFGTPEAVYAMETAATTEDGKVNTDENLNTDEGEKIVTLSMTGFTIGSNDISTNDTYASELRISGAAVSSFSFRIEMPWFVTIDSVEISEELRNVENAVYDINVEETGRSAYVAYSSVYEHTDVPVITVLYRFNSTEANREAAYLNEINLTNLNAEYLSYREEMGAIEVYDNAPAPVMGDADLDGEVTLADVMTIMRYIVKKDMEFSYEQFERADIDRNYTVDIIDCQYIQNYLAGLIGSLDDVNKDEGCNHNNYEELKRVDATCSDYGFVEYHCYDCGNIFTEDLYPTGNHVYNEEGNCMHCGQPEGGMDSSVVYQFAMNGKDYVLYNDGRCECSWVEKTADGMSSFINKAEGKWNYSEKGYIVTVEGERFEIDAPVTDKCNHENYEEINRLEPTCIASGYIEYMCLDCNEYFSYPLAPNGEHRYDDKGICTECGTSMSSPDPIEVTIEEATEIASDLNLVIVGKTTYTVTGTVGEDKKYDSGLYCIEDGNGGSLLIFNMNGEELGFKPGEQVTIEGIPAKIYQDGLIVNAIANPVRTENAEGAIAIAEFAEIAHALYGASASTEEIYSITGTISEIVNYTYGNLYITDGLGNSIYIYGLYDAEGNRFDAIANQPLVGDVITVTGALTKYISGADTFKIEIINATLVGSNSDNKISIEEANTIGSALNITVEQTTPSVVTGIVDRIENADYGKMYLKDAEGNELFIYGFKDPSTVMNVRVGEEITVIGYGVKYYNAKENVVLIEMKDAELATADMVSVMEIISIAEFNANVSKLTGSNDTATVFEITATVDSVTNTTYGNLYIIDENGNTLYIYGLYDENGARYDSMETKPEAGDTITIRGAISNFVNSSNETIVEIKNATLVEIFSEKIDVTVPAE